MKKTVTESFITIVPAAGIGRRMQSSVPKQYLKIAGKSILEHTVAALRRHPLIEKVIIVIAEDDPYFAKTALATDPNIEVVFGGKERADSVYAGLIAAQKQGSYQWVLVHDAARPLIQADDIDNLIRYCLATNRDKLVENATEAVANKDIANKDIVKSDKSELAGAILATPIKETVKQVYSLENNQPAATANMAATTTELESGFVISKTVPRTNLFSAQTPQMFPLNLLKSSLEMAFENHLLVTDEASALELPGMKVGIVEGRSSNIKVTEPDDLDFCSFYLNKYQNKSK